MSEAKPLGLADLLDLLGYESDELFQLAHKPVGGQFTATVVPPEESVRIDTREVDVRGADWWFGVNPVRHVEQGRPGGADVTRLAGLWVDLDVKPGGCPTMDVARRIIAELESMLGERTVAVTQSGHGLQPIWAIEDGGPLVDAVKPGEPVPAYESAIPRPQARALLRRWGRLVAVVAERFGARVDSVFDLPRILRCPDTFNQKGGETRHVVTLPGGGAPLEVARVLEVLDEFGIADRPEDHDDPGAMVSPPAEWRFAGDSCGYAEHSIRGWSTERPDGNRHAWLVAQATRIGCLHRKGCLTAYDYRRAVETVTNRFRALLAGSHGESGPREPERGEIADAFAWGQSRAAGFSDTRLAEEVGGHSHRDERMANHVPLREIPGRAVRPADGAQSGGAAGLDTGGHRNVLMGLSSDSASPPRVVRQEHDHQGLPAPRLSLRELIRQAEASEGGVLPAGTLTMNDTHDRPEIVVPLAAATAELSPEEVELRAEVEHQARRLRIADEARKVEQQRKAGAVEIPRPVLGGEFLAVPDDPAQYRIAGLLPVGGRVVISAQFKSGKSVMMGNLVRSLVDGAPFLGSFTVAPVAGRVVLIDDELDERTLRRWLREQGIAGADRYSVVSLRGRVASFDLTNETVRAEWARNLKEASCAFLIFDCLRPVLDAIGLSEDKESGHFLVALDALARDAGIAEMAVVHHMGHSSERARGDSRLRDWPDAEWKIVRESGNEDDPAAPRYFSAFGRDVDVKEGALKLDGRRLTFHGDERRRKGNGKAEIERIPVEPAVEDVLRASTKPLSKHQIELALRAEGHAQKPIREAIERLIEGGLVTVEGKGRALLCQWSEHA